MNTRLFILSRLSLLAACFAFIVIGLGAFTRLTNAGLGCPDWPGCYGHFIVPRKSQDIQKASKRYPARPLNTKKAWAEMIHRYCAGMLGLLIMAIAIVSLLSAIRHGHMLLIIGMVLVVLVIYQAILGMWTVTLKLLPFVVAQHLLGGMAILALLWLMHLMAKNNHCVTLAAPEIQRIKPWALFGLALVFLQILLGAWTSTNYASLSCPNFPVCKMNVAWHYEFREAFNLASPIGINYEGGVLTSPARMTIQMVHRFGALILSAYLLILIFWINTNKRLKHRDQIRKCSYVLLGILGLQVGLGIANVIFQLPLSIALLHDLCAAMLLIVMITLNYWVFSYRMRETNNK